MRFSFRLLSITILILAVSLGYSQKINGVVTDNNGNPLSFASILIKNSTKGTTTNSNGKYFLSLSPGNYTVVCQYIGYERSEKHITLGKEDESLNIQLVPQLFSLGAVTVSSKGENPAYEIIRNTIKKRSYYQHQLDTFQCEVYQKGRLGLRDYPSKFLGVKMDFEDGDTSKSKMLYLSESLMTYSVQKDQYKVDILSTKVSGEQNAFGMSFPRFISFYQNNVSFGSGLNPRGFISPIADNALSFYKYKYKGSYFEDGREIHHIQVIPKRTYEPLFSGYVDIVEGDWRIHSIALELVKESQMQLLDTLRIKQLHVPYNKDVWVMKMQVLYPAMKLFGFDMHGNFVTIYSKFDLNPFFVKNFFGNTIVKYEEGSNRKNLQYWDTIRPVPLQEVEQKDYIKKDSLEKLREDPHYKDSIDRIRNKATLSGTMFLGHNISNENKRSFITLHPLIRSISFNTVEGWTGGIKATYNKYLDSTRNKELVIQPMIRYGFSNKHFNSYTEISYSVKRKYISSISIGGGKDVYQFNNTNPINPFLNTFSTLLWEHNYMKIYEAWTGKVSYLKGISSGLNAFIGFEYLERLPLENITDKNWKDWENRAYIPNYPTDLMEKNFTHHQASILTSGVHWQPGTKYVEYPDKRVSLGSKYPVFTAEIKIGLKDILGSDVDYGKWLVNVEDNLNLKMAGTIKYNFSIGGFYRAKNVAVADYKHFAGNEITVVNNYSNCFLLLPYYKFSNTATMYGEAHIAHHFNGALTNKIPLFKRLNWHLVGSTNMFYVNKQNNYLEATVGVENILKVLRLDFAWGFEYGKSSYTGFRLGLNRGLFGKK